MKIDIFVYIVIILSLSSCKGQVLSTQDQINCFQSSTKTSEKTELVKTIKKQLFDTIQSWIDSKVYLAQHYKTSNWTIDDAIFFNTKKDKAILLILEQDTSKNAKMDDTEMILAKRNNDLWNFYTAGMLSISSMRYYNKKDPETPYTFKELSDKVINEIIKGGYFKKNSCEINDDYINGWDIDLEIKHKRFLSNKKL